MEQTPPNGPKPYVEQRPWGQFTQFTSGSGEVVTVKTIFVKRGEGLSLQRHKLRDEQWCVLSGTPTITIDSRVQDGRLGDLFYIPRGSVHRLEAGSDNDVLMLEVARGEFKEDDIERFDDRYGRA